MNIVEGLKELEVMRSAGTLSDAEFAQAKDRLLSEDSQSGTVNVSQQVAVTNLNLELERIDREWSVEKDQYMIVTKYGERMPPDENLGSICFACCVIMVFALFMGIFTANISAMLGPAVPLFSAVIYLFGAASCIGFFGPIWFMSDVYFKAERYKEARAQYLRGRAEVERQLDKAKQKLTDNWHVNRVLPFRSQCE